MSAEVGNLSFDLLSLNVRGIRSNGKRMTIFNWLNTHTSDQAIIFLQERIPSEAMKIHGLPSLVVKTFSTLTDNVTLVGS